MVCSDLSSPFLSASLPTLIDRVLQISGTFINFFNTPLYSSTNLVSSYFYRLRFDRNEGNSGHYAPFLRTHFGRTMLYSVILIQFSFFPLLPIDSWQEYSAIRSFLAVPQYSPANLMFFQLLSVKFCQ